MVRDIDDIVEEIVLEMDVSLSVKAFEPAQPSHQLVKLCDTKYLKLYGYFTEVSSDGLERNWTVLSYDNGNGYLSLLPPLKYPGEVLAELDFNSTIYLPRPYYFRGTKMAVNYEYVNFSQDERERTPMIWLVKPTREVWNNKESSIERQSNLRLFFLTIADYLNDLTKDHIEKRTHPLIELAHVFVNHIETSGKFNRKVSFETRDFQRFGSEAENGIIKNILDSNMSGIEVTMSIEINRIGCDC